MRPMLLVCIGNRIGPRKINNRLISRVFSEVAVMRNITRVFGKSFAALAHHQNRNHRDPAQKCVP